MIDSIKKYFIDPIYTGSGYNIFNTLVYGLLLGVGIILSYKIIEKFKIRIDEKFLLGLLPFLILGSMLRALEDALLLPKSAFFITPGIFFTIFGIVIFALVVAALLREKKGYEFHITLGVLGLLLLPYPAFIILKNILIYSPLFYTLSTLIVSTVVIIGAINYWNITYMKGRWISSIIAAHMLDASATVVAVELYGYWEEHYFEGAIIDSIGTGLVIYPLKIIVLFTAIYIIQKAVEDENAVNFWYIALFILGFSPGLRDLLKIMLVG
jgi:uncharacterized membrane protein